jgi:hypothetical protein
VEGNRVSYRRGGLTEWYLNGPLGLEQGFTLERRPAGVGSLTLAVRADGALRPRRSGAQVVFAAGGGPVVARYGGLYALDAAARPLPAWIVLAGRTLLLRIDDSGARYPLTVDPFLQQGGKLTGSGEVGTGGFGGSVALAADGKTALVGGSNDDANKGAAWVFTRSGSAWTQQGGKLTGGSETGAGRFGVSVALAADGSTALVGGYGDDNYQGAAWVFIRSGSSWTQQGGKLTGGGATGKAEFGASVALSADGSTALVGGYGDDGSKGAAWVFTLPGSIWTQQGGKLTGGGATGNALFGGSVALAADGSTALVGGSFDDTHRGAAWVFIRTALSRPLTGFAWNQQGGKLTGADATGNGSFGGSVALAADGSTALVAGQGDDNFKGAAWVFTRSGSTWTQQGAKLTGGGETGNGQFGGSVALAADGSTALVGGPADDGRKGAAWVFSRSGSSWTQQGGKLTGSGATGNASFGGSVALAGDGNTALVGGPYDGDKGAAWVFRSAPPAVSAITPGSGAAAGGTLVKISGTSLSAVTAVKFGATAATLTKVVSDTEIRAVSPPGQAGTVDVTVTGPAGTSAASSAARFTYASPPTTTTPTTTPTAPAAGRPLVARIVYVTVLGHGKLRRLDVRIRVSRPAKAQLRLLARGVTKLRRTFAVRGGGNELKAPLARTVKKGTYQLRITLSDGSGHKRVYTATVPVPA